MRVLSKLTTAAVTAVALAVPTAVVAAGTAGAADGAVAAATYETAAVNVKLNRAAKGSHHGAPGVKMTAVVKRNGKAAKGKVVFFVKNKRMKAVRLKKGRAVYRLPSSLKAGKYLVRAKYGKQIARSRVVVYNSALKLSQVAFTISKKTPSYDLATPTGTVKYKGKKAETGYVDIYQGGRFKKGNNSKWYVGMATVKDGNFQLTPYSFLQQVQKKKPGTYRFKAFYTVTASWAEYVHSSWITVKVTE